MADDENHRELVELLQFYIGSNSTVGNDVTQIMQELPSGGERLYATATPFIFVIGLVGNLVSLRVFSGTPRMRRLSASLYLSAISVSDCLVLLTYVLLDWINRGLPMWPGHYRIRIVNTRGVCEMFLFMSYMCRFVSIWLIVLFTIERYIAVCRPFRRRVVCTKTFAHRAIALVVLIAAIASFHKPLLSGVYDVRPPTINADHLLSGVNQEFIDFSNATHSLSRDGNVTSSWPSDLQDGGEFLHPFLAEHADETVEDFRVCRHNPAYDGTYMSFIMELIYGSSITAVPFVPIALFNMAILRALLTRDAVSRVLSQSINTEKRVRREFTVLVLVISASLICLSLPYFVVWCIQFIQSRNPEDPVVAHWIRDKLLATKTIFFLNYSINFVLYSLAGANYRTAVVTMLPSPCCKTLDPSLTARPTGSIALHRMPSSTLLSSVRVLDARRATNV